MKNEKDQEIIPKMYPRIKCNELLSFDILLLYYGNKLTSWHGQLGQDEKYGRTTIAPYHTNIVYDLGKTWGKVVLMDTEVQNTAGILESEYGVKKELRIDVVRRKQIDPENAKILASHLEKEIAAESWYGVTRFGSFAKRLKYVGWMFKWMKPNSTQIVCSGRVAWGWELIGDPISAYPYNETIPNDISIWAIHHPEKYDVYTLKLPGELL